MYRSVADAPSAVGARGRATAATPAGCPARSPEWATGGVDGRDVELRRGDLTRILYGAVRDDVEFRFDDSIASLTERDDGVDVTFESGLRRRFDLVLGADGLHSRTRSLAFGPEQGYHRYLGSCFAGFTMANDFGLAHEGVVWNAPGRLAALYAAGAGAEVNALLSFERADPPVDVHRDPAAQRALVAAVFADAGWEVPRMLSAMEAADDLFFDVVSQIHMPRWSTGRTALVGDAAHAPSFRSGQGTSIALVGAYVLAGELATATDHAAAFDAYERRIRQFVELNQSHAAAGGSFLSPSTEEELAARNAALADAEFLTGTEGRTATTALELPEYAMAGIGRTD